MTLEPTMYAPQKFVPLIIGLGQQREVEFEVALNKPKSPALHAPDPCAEANVTIAAEARVALNNIVKRSSG